MLRRQRSPRGQEDALGILAYVAAFEAIIAKPYRTLAETKNLPKVPIYEQAAIKDSLTANLETKRRQRIQKNVAAAVVPAFSAAMLSLANAIYGRSTNYKPPTRAFEWLGSFVVHPVSTTITALQANEWLFPVLAILGFVWIVSFAGVFQPSERWYVKGGAQAAAVWGPVLSALGMAIAAAITVAIIIGLMHL